MRVEDVEVGGTVSLLHEGIRVIAWEAAIVVGASGRSLVGGITESEIVNETGWSEQWLDGDDLVCDQLWVNPTDQWYGDPFELCDVGGVG